MNASDPDRSFSPREKRVLTWLAIPFALYVLVIALATGLDVSQTLSVLVTAVSAWSVLGTAVLFVLGPRPVHPALSALSRAALLSLLMSATTFFFTAVAGLNTVDNHTAEAAEWSAALIRRVVRPLWIAWMLLAAYLYRTRVRRVIRAWSPGPARRG